MPGTLKAWRNVLLRFGLVSVPVSLVPAKSDTSVRAHRYDRATNERVRQAWTTDGATLAEDVFLAYDVDGTPVEIDAPVLEGEKEIRLEAFVSEGTIDPLFYDSAYILYAGKGGSEGLGVVAAMLRDSGYSMLAGTARFTDRPRSVVIRWSEAAGCLVLHVLTFASRVRFYDFRTAAETLAEPSAELLTQAEIFADALPDEFVPADEDPLEAAILAALRTAAPKGKRDAIPAASTTAGDILETLRADVSTRARDTKGKRSGTKSTKRSTAAS